jgi:hypothetical protein
VTPGTSYRPAAADLDASVAWTRTAPAYAVRVRLSAPVVPGGGAATGVSVAVKTPLDRDGLDRV